jgi:hypothetical protein
MSVIPFKPARPRADLRTRVQPPPALASHARSPEAPQGADEVEDRRRMRENLAAAAVVIVLVVLGAWLMQRLENYSRVLMCMEAGHHNCVPLDVGHTDPR